MVYSELGTTPPYATSSVILWGLSTDIPMTGDFDGDGNSDVTVWTPSQEFGVYDQVVIQVPGITECNGGRSGTNRGSVTSTGMGKVTWRCGPLPMDFGVYNQAVIQVQGITQFNGGCLGTSRWSVTSTEMGRVT